MKAIILAAGKGSRLGYPDLPKPLTPLVNGKSILSSQLDTLRNVISWDNIIIVVGYRKEAIMEAHPDFMYVYCPRYGQENTSKSLLKALRKVDDDVIWINGDVVFHPSVLEQAIVEKNSWMVVNVGPVGEEEVKYRTDGRGKILEVSKQVGISEGEALGINCLKRQDVIAMTRALESCGEMDYFEKGIEKCIHEGMNVRAIQVDRNLCTEVDFPEDLTRANRLISEW